MLCEAVNFKLHILEGVDPIKLLWLGLQGIVALGHRHVGDII